MIDDTTLLRRYAAERAEDAFAEFVRRQLPFVYSAALRRLGGDTHRAEDVAQVVFSAVARDAHRLSQHALLTGWLYTATRNAVIDVMRAEKRRRAREQEAHIMQTISGDIESPADWSRLSPVLDAAMDELSRADREAVLLRFFQGRPFGEIGAGLGLSEDTARKRVERALDKLRTGLRRHGIGSTSAALATLLSTETVCGAPAGLVASITGAALGSSGATAGAVGLITVSKLQVGIAATILAGGAFGLISQQRTITGLRESTAATQQYLAKLETDQAASAKVRAEADADVAKLRAELSALPKPGGAGNGQIEATRVSPARAEAALIVLGSLPDTPEIRKQKDYWHRRYDPFFQQRGLTAAQGDRFVELKIHQAIAREEFQAAVRAANLRGDSRGVQALRAKDDSPVTRELFEMLGKEGYTAYGTYERTSAYRMSYVEPLMSECAAARVPLSAEQAEQMLSVFATNARSVWANPTDIGTTGSMDWDAVVAQAAGILTPAQSAALQKHASRRKPSQRSQ